MRNKILSPLVLVLVFCLGFNPVSNASGFLPFGINGFYPGSGREATDFDKNFTLDGFNATQFKMPPENGTQIQQIGFQIFQDLFNHTGVKGMSGKLTDNGFGQPEQKYNVDLYTSLASMGGPLASESSSNRFSMDSFIPKLRNTSLAAFGQGFALKLSKKQDTVAVKDKIIHNLIKYLTNIKATVNRGKLESYFTRLDLDNIPSFFIYPTKYLEFEVYTNYKNYNEDEEHKNKRKTGDLEVSMNVRAVRVDSKYLEDNPAFNPNSIIKHGIFRQTK